MEFFALLAMSGGIHGERLGILIPLLLSMQLRGLQVPSHLTELLRPSSLSLYHSLTSGTLTQRDGNNEVGKCQCSSPMRGDITPQRVNSHQHGAETDMDTQLFRHMV